MGRAGVLYRVCFPRTCSGPPLSQTPSGYEPASGCGRCAHSAPRCDASARFGRCGQALPRGGADHNPSRSRPWVRPMPAPPLPGTWASRDRGCDETFAAPARTERQGTTGAVARFCGEPPR